MQTFVTYRRTRLFLIPLLASILVPLAAQQPRPSTGGQQDDKKYKAIFEPVNYGEDLELTSVAFVSPEEGWVTGAAGTLLHTTTGGKEWTALLGGDPQGSGRAIRDLRHATGKVLFAAQVTATGDHALLRTTDGESWSEQGTVAQHRRDYEFVSADTGVQLYRGDIQHTTNGGKTWSVVYTCAVTLQVSGLNRKVGCEFESLDFPTSEVGYAVSRSLGDAAFVVAKTTNGGAAWETWTIEEPNARPEHVSFVDDQRGFIRVRAGAIYSTSDGGKTWTKTAGVTLPGGTAATLQFPDDAVGWGLSPYGDLIYTVDGGKRWLSRRLNFPAGVDAFSLVSRDTAYVVGDHGMVYRYRIVPATYSVPNMIPAPMMPQAAR